MRVPAFMKKGNKGIWYKGLGGLLNPAKIILLVYLAVCVMCISSAAKAETLNLTSGWNLLASRVNISSNVLSSWSVESIWKWSGSWEVYLPQQSDKGYAYAKNKGFDLIEQIQPGEGFWVKSNSALSLSVSGTEVEEGNISFSADWNLKGLKTNNKVYVPEMFSDSTKVKSVWKWDNGTWAVYLPGGDTKTYAESKGFAELSHIMPNEGFWVKSETSFNVDTSQSTLSDEEIEKAFASTYSGASVAGSLGQIGVGAPSDIASGLMKIQLFETSLFEAKLPESVFKEALYGSYASSTQCTYGGNISFSASWDGSDYPSSLSEIYNPKLLANVANCHEKEGTFSGNMSIELYGSLSNPTGGKMTFSQLSGTFVVPPYGNVSFNFPSLIMTFTMNGYNDVELTVNGSGSVILGKQSLTAKYYNFKINQKESYTGLQLIINGSYYSNYTNGKITLQTIKTLQFDSDGNPVSGHLNLLTSNSTISITLSNGSYTISRNGKFLKTVSNADLNNLFK